MDLVMQSRSPEAPATPLRHALRLATHEVHEQLHDHPLLAALSNGTITPGQNRDLVGRMAGFYHVADPMLARACTRLAHVLDPYCYEPRADRLNPAAPPANAPLVEPHDLPTLAGALYVVDGALIGGQLLARSAAAADLTDGADHWDWCARHGQAIWRSTQRVMDLADTGPDSHRAACATAKAWFAAFAMAMSPEGSAPKAAAGA